MRDREREEKRDDGSDGHVGREEGEVMELVAKDKHMSLYPSSSLTVSLSLAFI